MSGLSNSIQKLVINDKKVKDIIERDYRDSHRENSPLMQAEDAVLVDSSDMTIDEVARRIVDLYREKI